MIVTNSVNFLSLRMSAFPLFLEFIFIGYRIPKLTAPFFLYHLRNVVPLFLTSLVSDEKSIILIVVSL